MFDFKKHPKINYILLEDSMLLSKILKSVLDLDTTADGYDSSNKLVYGGIDKITFQVCNILLVLNRHQEVLDMTAIVQLFHFLTLHGKIMIKVVYNKIALHNFRAFAKFVLANPELVLCRAVDQTFRDELVNWIKYP